MGVVHERQGLMASAAILAVTFAPWSVDAEVLTLDEVEAMALEDASRWTSDRARVAQADGELDLARAVRRPTVTLDANGFLAPGSNIAQVPTVDGSIATVRASPTIGEATAFRANARYETRIAIRAPLYDFGRSKARLNAARATQSAAEIGASGSREAVIAEVRTSYLDWLAMYTVRGHAQATGEDAAKRVERVAARVEDGERAPTELDAARQAELRDRLAAVRAEADLDAAKRRLETTVGWSLPAGAEPDSTLLDLPARDTGVAALSAAQSIEEESRAARLEALAVRRLRRPVLAAVAQVGFQGVNDSVFPGYRLGLTLNVALWDGGRALAEARVLDALSEELDGLASELRRALDADFEMMESRQSSLETELAIAEELVAVSERRLAQAEATEELGAGDLEATADARVALREARSQLVWIQIARAASILGLTDYRRPGRDPNTN